MNPALLMTALSLNALLLDGRARQTLAFETHQSTRTISGISHTLEGAVEELPDGTVRAQLRSAVHSFATGSGLFDREIQEALESARFPAIDVKVVVPPDSWGAWAGPHRGMINARVQLTLHGVSRTLQVPVEVTPQVDQRTAVRGAFSMRLQDFGVALPSASSVDVRFDLLTLLNPSFSAAPVAGGSTLSLGLSPSIGTGR
jgi:hypothetical protein